MDIRKLVKTEYLVFLILVAGLFASNFVFWPLAKVPFEIPKVYFISRWIEVLAITAILFSPKNFISEHFDKKIIYLTGLFVLFSFISSIFGSNLEKSIVGNYYRGDGLLTLFHLAIFMLLIAIFSNKIWVDKYISVLAFSAISLSTISIISVLIFLLFNLQIPYLGAWQDAIGLTFGNPNFLAGFLLVTLPFNYYLLNKNNNLLAKLMFMVQIIAILLTRAWSGVLGIIIFMLGVFILKKKKVVIFALIIAIIFLGKYLLTYNNLLVQPTDGNFIGESRQRIFMKGILAFQKKPTLGFGVSNFDYAFQSVDWPIKINNDVYVDKAHSMFLEVLTTTGILGFTIYMFLLCNIFMNLSRYPDQLKNYLLLAFLLFVIHSQMNIISISEELVFWLLAGISARKFNYSSDETKY